MDENFAMLTLDLQRIRKEFGVTQKALADMLNINQSFLSNIENGRSPLPPDKREKILEAFHITRPDEYTIDIPTSYSIKNVQRSIIGGNKFLNNSSVESSAVIAEIRTILERYLANNNEQENLTVILSDQLEKCANRINSLEAKNEALYEKNDLLRAKLEEVQEEVFTLRRLLADNGISYENNSDSQKTRKSQSGNL